MIENITSSAAVAPGVSSDHTSKDPQGGGGASQPASATSTPSSPSTDDSDVAPQAKPTTRLLIDQDKVTGVFVYRIVDSQTGELLAEIPNEQIANLKNADDYITGSVISTSA